MPAPRPPRLLVRHLAALAALAACADAGPAVPARRDPARDRAVADTLRALVVRASDLSDTNVVRRFLSLYPAEGRVVSAAGGRLTTSRDTIAEGIRRFYARVGSNMQNPAWEWGPMHVDLLGPDAAVLSAEYRIPHRTPEGAPHTISGAWTAVFARRGGRWVVVQEHLSDRPAPAP